jgi:hypothetical protein
MMNHQGRRFVAAALSKSNENGSYRILNYE